MYARLCVGAIAVPVPAEIVCVVLGDYKNVVEVRELDPPRHDIVTNWVFGVGRPTPQSIVSLGDFVCPQIVCAAS